VNLMPVPSEQGNVTCSNCGAALVADQRYCLSCGQPCSPVRLAFLDVLQAEHSQPAIRRSAIEIGPASYMPLADQHGSSGWLRRYSGLLGLLSVLLMCLLVGLLVGHWVTQSKAPGPQVLKVEGLSAAPAAAAAGAPTTAAAPAASPTSSSSAKAEAEEAKAEAKETKAEKAPPPKPVTVPTQTLKKLSSSKGSQHQKEINKLIEGGQPIETGH
jgi:hypothetical protein